MGFVCWISKATDTHPGYVTLTAFLQQHWLRVSSSLSRLYGNCFFVRNSSLDIQQTEERVHIKY